MDRIVRIYWNLHRRCWSIKSVGEPVRHRPYLAVTDARFRVWEGGRKRVLRERKKNVHAFVEGKVLNDEKSIESLPNLLVQVGYNPYRKPEEPGHFYRKDNEERVDKATLVVLTREGRVFADLGDS